MLSDRVPLFVLDEMLTGGGNRDKSQLRIAAIFMSDIPEEKRSVLLAKEYDTTDIGLQIDGEKYAVYCDPHGIQIAYGDMVDGATDKAFVSWETAVSRIETLLVEGRFLPRSSWTMLWTMSAKNWRKAFYSPTVIIILISMTSHILILRNYTTVLSRTQKKSLPDGSILQRTFKNT